MNTILHVVAKDLRRLAGPLALWLGLVTLKAAALVAYAGSSLPWPGEWIEPAVACANGLEAVLGFVLAVLLTLDDSPADERAFWRTRPISGGAMIAAKLCGAAGAFVVAPVLLLAPVWLAAGFDARELGLAALDWTLVRGGATLAALALAATAGGLARAIFAGAGLCLLVPVGAMMGWDSPGGVAGWVVLAVVTTGAALMLQYVHRRRLAAILTLAAGYGVFCGGMVWTWSARASTRTIIAEPAGAERPVVVGSSQEMTGGRCRIYAIREGRVTMRDTAGVGHVREHVSTRVELREVGFGGWILDGVFGPEPVLRSRSDGDEPVKIEAGRRGWVRVASIRVGDFEAELPAGAEKTATWHGWRTAKATTTTEN